MKFPLYRYHLGANAICCTELWYAQGRYEHAGTLFERAGRAHISQAVKAYYKAKLPIVALKFLLRAGKYKEIVEDLTRYVSHWHTMELRRYIVFTIRLIETPCIYRYKDQIPARERKPIARQLNTLLRQGKIPKQLKEKTFDLLASDQEKKEFLKDFKHFNELWQFLAKGHKLDEAVDELMDAFELDLLLKNSFESDEKWQHSRRGRLAGIYNCMTAEKLLSGISNGSNKMVDAVLQSSSNSPYAKAIWGQEWSNAFGAMEDTIRNRVLPVRNTVEKVNPWSADFLTAMVRTSSILYRFIPVLFPVRIF